LPVIVLGAVGPWVTRFGVRVDGWQDEVVLILGVVAACIVLYLARTERRWIAAAPFLIGLTAAALVANDIRDPGDVAPGAGSHLASLQWGIYLSLGGSATLALASALLLVDSPRLATRRTRGSARRSALWQELPSITPYVAAEHRNALFLVPTHDRKAGLFVENRRPRQFVRLARAVKILREAGRLPEGGVILDVGAHIGTTSIMALSQHGFARAVSIEPDPDNVRMLHASAALNGLADRIRVIQAALADSAAKWFFVPGRRRGGWAEGRLTAKPSAGASAVETVRLDDLVEKGVLDPSEVRLIWCGHPVAGALADSATTFFERRVPLVIATGAADEGARVLLRRLAGYYEHAIDLRCDLDEPLSTWAPRVIAPDQISDRSFAVHTDVLVF
jgi:FkbM family methyltransferase